MEHIQDRLTKKPKFWLFQAKTPLSGDGELINYIREKIQTFFDKILAATAYETPRWVLQIDFKIPIHCDFMNFS